MIFLVLCTVTFVMVNDYLYTKNNFDHQALILESQTEQNIDGAMRLTDVAWNVFDSGLNDRMENGLNRTLAAYIAAGNDPAAMDLQGLKKDLGGDIDIYIINESGVIEYTTFSPELGQDFRSVPYFYQYLTKIRLSQGFFPDRVVREQLGSGNFRKFAYMPTPDHRYVLELGLEGTSLQIMSNRLDNYANTEEIVSSNPYVTGFRIFNSMDHQVNDNSLPEPNVQAILDNVIKTRTSETVFDPKNGTKIVYLFVDLRSNTGSDLSRVVEITYSTKLQQDALNQLLLTHLAIALGAIILGCALAVLLSRMQIRQIRQIVSDADKIAHGNLDHKIGSTSAQEFRVLEESINTMINALKQNIQKVEDGERLQKQVIDQLPVAVFMKNVDNGKYVYWNRTSEQIFGMESKDIIGKTDRELFSEKVIAGIRAEDAEACRSRIIVRNKVISGSRQGIRILHMIVAAITDGSGQPQFILGVAEDVTSENANLKMDLVYSITRHEILDQLSRIMSSMERAQLKQSKEDFQSFMDKTLGSVESIKNQISYMRGLQDLGIISPTWQNLDKSVDEALNLITTGNVKIMRDTGAFEIYADPLLPRILVSLLENSLRHGGPRLSLIKITSQESGGSLHLIVEDNGAGVRLEKKSLIFDPGYGEGTGLSLFIIRELLGFTGISITETGEFGKGARFEIKIPKGVYKK